MERRHYEETRGAQPFLHDIYHGEGTLEAGVIPAEQVLTNEAYHVAMLGLELPNHVHSHVAGLGRVVHAREPQDDDAAFPELFARQRVHPVEHYPGMLLQTARVGRTTTIATRSSYAAIRHWASPARSASPRAT